MFGPIHFSIFIFNYMHRTSKFKVLLQGMYGCSLYVNINQSINQSFGKHDANFKKRINRTQFNSKVDIQNSNLPLKYKKNDIWCWNPGPGLWQSHICGGVKPVMQHSTQKQTTCIQYWWWMVGSQKFLIDFNVLGSILYIKLFLFRQ